MKRCYKTILTDDDDSDDFDFELDDELSLEVGLTKSLSEGGKGASAGAGLAPPDTSFRIKSGLEWTMSRRSSRVFL